MRPAPFDDHDTAASEPRVRAHQLSVREHPRPGWNGGRRYAARPNERHAVSLPREQRQQLHFERVARWHALHDERTLLALLAEADALELERRVLGNDLAADVGHLGAQAP